MVSWVQRLRLIGGWNSWSQPGLQRPQLHQINRPINRPWLQFQDQPRRQTDPVQLPIATISHPNSNQPKAMLTSWQCPTANLPAAAITSDSDSSHTVSSIPPTHTHKISFPSKWHTQPPPSGIHQGRAPIANRNPNPSVQARPKFRCLSFWGSKQAAWLLLPRALLTPTYLLPRCSVSHSHRHHPQSAAHLSQSVRWGTN